MKFLKKIILLSFLISATVFSQAIYKKSFYSGTIDNKYQVGFDVQIEGKSISGTYFYSNQDNFLWVNGEIDKNKMFKLSEETNDGVKTGTITGQISKDENSIEGFWTSADNKKKLFIKLLKEAEYKQIRHKVYDVNVEYPSFCINGRTEFRKIDEAVSKLAKQYYDSSYVFVQTAIADFGHEEGEDTTKYSCGSSCSVRYSDTNIKSIVETHNSYSGGAHPGYYYSCHTFDKNGNIILLSSVIDMSSKSINQINKLIVEILRKKQADWIMDGSIQGFAKEISLDQIPYIFTSTGIYFYFSPYVAGSYAQGTFVTIIPYSKIKNIIKPDSPIKYLIK